jgi:hypothetical protein
MPLALRARLAVAAILAVLLIPVATSSLRGLTHVLTCKAPINTPFTIQAPEDRKPTAQSSLVIERDQPSRLLCGGLSATIGATGTAPGRAELELDLRNQSKHTWRGSVSVVLDGTTIPVNVGRVSAGHTERATVTLHLRRSKTHEVKGSLLIGP